MLYGYSHSNELPLLFIALDGLLCVIYHPDHAVVLAAPSQAHNPDLRAIGQIATLPPRRRLALSPTVDPKPFC